MPHLSLPAYEPLHCRLHPPPACGVPHTLNLPVAWLTAAAIDGIFNSPVSATITQWRKNGNDNISLSVRGNIFNITYLAKKYLCDSAHLNSAGGMYNAKLNFSFDHGVSWAQKPR